MKLEDLSKAVHTHAAIRGTARLQPIGGVGDKVFPPTHMVDDRAKERGARYASEERRIDGANRQVVLLDSVQSQANRMEEALYALWKTKKVRLPVVEVDLGLPDLPSVSSLTAPHRIADALLRDSLDGDTLFRYSKLGTSFTDASQSNAGPLFRVCPTACLFGVWDSTGPKGGLGFKLARAVTSEIIAVDAVFGVKTSSRIDPTNIAKNAGVLYETDDEKEAYTLDPKKARKDEKSKEPIKLKKKGSPAEANLGNIPPTVDALGGGVTFAYAHQTVVVSLGALRKLRFGDDAATDSARTALAALGLVSVLAGADAGYDLRSRCSLIPESAHALTLHWVHKDGTTRPLEIDLTQALTLLSEAAQKLPSALAWPEVGQPLSTLKPTPKLKTLIERTRELAISGELGD